MLLRHQSDSRAGPVRDDDGGYFVPAFNGVDESGYVVSGRRLAVAGDLAQRTSDPFEFVSGNSVETEPGVYYAKYPIGYPALVAVAYKLGGPAATFLVNPILATLAVFGIFLFARALLDDMAGVFAAILLATNPLHDYFGLSSLSHTGSLCFAVWGMYFVWEWSQRGGWWRALLGGALAAYAVSVRYTEALLVLPVLATIVWRWRRPHCGREVLIMLVAGVVALLPLLMQHVVAYGSIFTSGYSLCGEATGFGWQWFKDNWNLMLTRMDDNGLLLLFPLGLVGLLYLGTRDRRRAVFLALWAVPSLLLYSAYYWAPRGEGPGYVRFFVSVFPPLIVSALALFEGALAATPRRRSVLTGAYVLLVAAVNLHDGRELLAKQMERLVFNRQTSVAVMSALPTNAVIYANAGLLNYVEFLGDYRLYAQETYDRGAIARSLDVLKDDEPHPFQRQKAQRIANLLGPKNDSQLLALERARLAQQVADGRTIALIANEDGLRRWRGRLAGQYQFEPVADWSELRSRPARNRKYYEPAPEELLSAAWALYVLRPRGPEPDLSEMAALEEKLDVTRESIRQMRAEYDERYPGAQQQWAQIAALERDSREMNNQLRQLKSKIRPAARHPKPQASAQHPVAVAAGKGVPQ